MDLFSEGLNHYVDERGLFGGTDPRFLRHDRALTFFNAARGSLVSGAILTFQQQLFDASKPLRGALEAALAGVHVFGDADAWSRWRSRPTFEDCRGGSDEKARLRREIGAEFSMYRLAGDLRPWSSRLTDIALDLYDELNDLGAHFNFAAAHLMDPGADNRELAAALRRLNRTAAVCLRIYDCLYAGFSLNAKLSQRIEALTRL